jgi:hypothetical protein
MQPQQEPIVALAQGINRLLVDQHRIDDETHLDKLMLRAKRETSRVATAPTLPRQAATMRSNPARVTPPAADAAMAQCRNTISWSIAARRCRDCAGLDGVRTGARKGLPCAPDDAAGSCQTSWRASSGCGRRFAACVFEDEGSQQARRRLVWLF